MAHCEIRIRVTPRAKRDEVVGERGGCLAIKLAAPPVRGAANEALLAFLREKLGLPKSAMTLISGKTSREKRVRIEGLSEETVRARLLD